MLHSLFLVNMPLIFVAWHLTAKRSLQSNILCRGKREAGRCCARACCFLTALNVSSYLGFSNKTQFTEDAPITHLHYFAVGIWLVLGSVVLIEAGSAGGFEYTQRLKESQGTCVCEHRGCVLSVSLRLQVQCGKGCSGSSTYCVAQKVCTWHGTSGAVMRCS